MRAQAMLLQGVKNEIVARPIGWSARVSPRAAGWLAIAGSLLLAVLGGFLLATPPWSIPGAIVLVVATILFSVGTISLYRRSWSDPWPPDTTPSLQKQLRITRVMQIVFSVLFVAMIASAIYAIVTQNWGQLLIATIFLLTGLSNLRIIRRNLRQLRDTQASTPAE
jgi:uncharacterized membrane protein YbhN (UPF0104 family)